MSASLDRPVRPRVGRQALGLRELTWGAACIALGLAVPALFHAVGLGSVFLPMFLPLLAAGLLLPKLPAVMVGALTPPLSALLTGMPPLVPPVAPVMAIEGAVLGLLSSWLYRDRGWQIVLAAAVAVLGQRLIMVMVTMILAPLFGLPGRLAALTLLLQGLPGVLLLVLGVPLLVRRFQRLLRLEQGA